MNRSFYNDVHIDWDTWCPPTKYTPLALPKDVFALPGEPTVLGLEGQEKTLLQMLALYTAECYPELLKPLALSRYKDEEFTAHRRYSGWWQVSVLPPIILVKLV